VFGTPGGTLQIDPCGLDPVVLTDGVQGRGTHDPRIVDQNVNAAERFHHPGHGVFNRRFTTDVRHQAKGRGTGPGQLPGHVNDTIVGIQ
jgi:hypothetical protein